VKEVIIEFKEGELKGEKIDKNNYVLLLELEKFNIEMSISEISFTLMQQALRRIKKQKLKKEVEE
jgi:hypothetical protein